MISEMFKTFDKQCTKLSQSTYNMTYSFHATEYNLRNRPIEDKLVLPKPYIKAKLQLYWSLLWNNLPQELRDAGSIGMF